MTEEDKITTPEDILERVKREESLQDKGRLKIFLGMAAGVGKTYAMLESAQKLQKDGVDVVAGIIDTHGRKETQRLLDGLEILPQKTMTYKGAEFHEFDIDAVLIRSPKIILVDELAHSNIPGSRHPKRWQDVIEILDHGIDVHTTLNVQHIESLRDVIEKITGINIRETVPDLVIEKADSIELIDITPDELLHRLKEGKVYFADQSVIAAKNFFQEDRLTALREMVLRYAANKVDHDLKGMIATTMRSDPWRARERLLVAVSHSPHSQKLIRITRGLAFNLDAPWYAVNIDTGLNLDADEKIMLEKNLNLARDLGAEVISTSDSSPGIGIQRIARQKNITQIIVGRPPRKWYDVFIRNTIMDHLIKECSDIDLHIIRQSSLYYRLNKKWKFPKISSNFVPYLVTFGAIICLTLFNLYFLTSAEYKLSRTIFFIGTLFLSLFFDKGPIFFGSILYATIWIEYFLPTAGGISLHNEDIKVLIMYVLASIGISFFTERARKQREVIYKREQSLEALYSIVKEIADAPSLDRVLASIKNRLNNLLNGRSEILIKNMEGQLLFEPISLFNDPKEKAAALWVFQNGKEAGWSTFTLPMTKNLYIPLKGRQGVAGVLSYQPLSDKPLSHEEKNFLLTVCSQIGIHLEHVYADERAKVVDRQKQAYRVYRSILDLIQNLFEGPLLIIKEAVNEMGKTAHKRYPLTMSTPLGRIDNSTGNLMHILDNISSMIQLISGDTPLNLKKGAITDLVKSCYQKCSVKASYYRWDIQVNENIPEFYFDHELIELVMINLIFYAMEYSLPDSMIQVKATLSGDYVILSVYEEVQSIPEEMIDISFENLYRMPATGHSGLGMGLAIVKVIIELHQGEFKTESPGGKGTTFMCYLPLKNLPDLV